MLSREHLGRAKALSASRFTRNRLCVLCGFSALGQKVCSWQDAHVIETGNAFDCLDIPSYEICNMDGRKVVLYSVLCKKDSRSWIAQRRYSDLRDLHLRVCKLGPTWHISMPFPGKRRFRSNQDPAFLDGRRSRMAE